MADPVRKGRRDSSGCSLNTRPSPIVLFAFNRPEETTQTLAALACNDGAKESELTVFCDGPRTAEDEEKTDQVRVIAQKAAGFKSVRVLMRSDNLGSVVAIRAGLRQMFDEHETVIVLEDDLTTSKYFLNFINKALVYYASEHRVASICGYSPSGITTSSQTYFLPGAHCWGWGAWRRTWVEADIDARKALDDLVQGDRIFEFDVAGAEPCTLLLHRAAKAERDSWVLPWMASAIIKNQLTLYPTQSLIRNDGLRASGLPVEWLHLFETSLANRSPKIGAAPLIADAAAFEHVRSLLIRWQCRDSRRQLLYNRLMNFLPVNFQRALYVARVQRSLRGSDQ